MKLNYFIVINLLFLCLQGLAQDIQWASNVTYQINQFSDAENSAEQALGLPNAEPYGVKSDKAFQLKSESDYGTMTLAYASPQQVSQVLIVENFKPGNVSKVILYDVDEKAYEIYDAEDTYQTKPFNVLKINVPKTDYMVAKVGVHLNTYVNNGWSQIDAVGISEELYEGEVISGANTAVTTESEEIIFLAKKERLGNNVNSKYLESKPVISPDGSTLFFARKNAPNNMGGKRDDQDIYVSDWILDEWSYAHNLDRPLNDKWPNGICSVSPDGNTLLLINAYHENGKIEDGVSISRKTTSGWSFPVKQEIEDYYNLSRFQDYFMSNSGMVLISAVEREDSKGSLDLYVSMRKSDDSWTRPVNMGSTINSEQVEFAPFLASDNKTLYFASNGRRGYGESDIYYSKRLDDTWTSWSRPTNIGKSVNSMNWDAYYTISAKGDYAYFISNSGLDKKINMNAIDDDIYRIALGKDEKPGPVVLVKGKVVNSKTKEPVQAAIYYESIPPGIEDGLASSDPVNGNYIITLPAGQKYGFRAEAKGYIAVSQYVDFTDVGAYREIVSDLELIPLLAGETIELNNVFFVQSSPEMLPESKPELERILQLLNDHPSLAIELGGHTDNQGSSAANLKLSEDRALAVMNFLIENGIDKSRLSHKGYGGTRPVASNASAESRSKNRRVEIKIVRF
jgi:outer membrane protein OmpA-like peptidoglycan-associated protein